MRTSITTALMGLLTLGFVGSALAQPARGRAAKPKAAEVKTYDFDGDTIEGDLVKPDGSSVDVRDFGKHGSLIRIRKDFINEILKSAEDL